MSSNPQPGFPEFKIQLGDLKDISRPKMTPWMWTALIVAILIGGIMVSSQIWTDLAWYFQLDRQNIVFTQWIARAALFLIAFIIAGTIIGLNLWISMRKKRIYPSLANESPSVSALRASFDSWRKPLMIILPLLLAIFGAVNFQASWTDFLALLNSTPFGTKDAIFGFDIAFFVFWLPALEAVLTLFFNAMAITLVVLAIYYVLGDISIAQKSISRHARIHLSVILAIISLLIALRYLLSRYWLLMGEHDKFSGASFTDIHAVLPARNILVGISLVVAILFIVGAFRKSWALPITGIGLMVASGILVGGAYPWLVQKFQVDPSAQQMEAPYIAHNIEATRQAFNIADVKAQTYTAKTEATPGQLRTDSESTTSIRLLDPDIISRTFGQLEQNRQYYKFPERLTVDRYQIDGKPQDTVIALRELDNTQLGQSQQSWVNQHTVYTHGFGVVAAYGSKVNSDGSPDFWEHGIPSQGVLGKYEPRIYFGQYSPEYSIVGGDKNSSKQEFDYPDDNAQNSEVKTTYSGNGGPSIGNAWERLMYALRFRSTEVFFSNQVNEHSQILFDRNPATRVSKVAPYLRLDKKPYPAVVDMDGDPSTPKRVVWIIDAYTTTDNYPYAAHQNVVTPSETTLGGLIQVDRYNYMRNSVKAVVDAYDGSVKLYQWDAKDPLLQTWSKAFPGQILPLADIPADLMSHLRYPEDLFQVQRNLLARYHTTNPEAFYSGADFWKLPEDPTHEEAGGTNPQPPYYLTMKMPGQDSTEFSLYSTYIPYGASDRNVLTGYLAVDSETGNEKGKVREGYGKMRLLSLPSDLAVPGPGQVSNKFKSEDKISTTLNLLGQTSTQVVRANLLTLPVGGGLLYVQPIYVQAKSGTTYPLLRFVLTSFGDKVGFGATLEESLNQLFGGDSGAVVNDEEGQQETPEGETPKPNTSLSEQLKKALNDANKALKAGQEALKQGDWTTYGSQQKLLQDAIEKAVQIETQVAGNTPDKTTPEVKPEVASAQPEAQTASLTVR